MIFLEVERGCGGGWGRKDKDHGVGGWGELGKRKTGLI